VSRGTLLALAALSALPAGARASSPSIGNVTPRGVQRGTEAVLVLNGARIADAQEVVFYTQGLTATKLEAVNDGQVKATVTVAPDCRIGEHALRLRTASGLSEVRTFYVGALPAVEEKEPNTQFAEAQPIPLDVTVSGVIPSEDVDYFAFEAKKGERVTAEVEAMRLGNTVFDPYVAILDGKRFELAAADDSALVAQDAVASVIIPEDGTYKVVVRESAYGGDGNCQYRLHVGRFPRPAAVLPAGGKAGEEIEVVFVGDVAGEMKQKVKLPAEVRGGFGVYAEDAKGISPSGNVFRLSLHGNAFEAEPNDDPGKATRAELPLAFNGVISKPRDADFFRFAARKGQVFDIHCYARRLRTPLDPVMVLYADGGGAIVGNDDAVGPDSYFRFTAPEDKDYVLSITDHLGKGGPEYVYRVEFTPIEPRVSLTIPRPVQYSQERQPVVVHRGNRYAALVTASRADFGGELVLSASGLPQGVAIATENIIAGADSVPVVFEAPADAPLAAALADLRATSKDPAQKLTSAFGQSVELTYGQNQSVFWKYDLNRLAVAVADEVPFTIRIVEPKAPLVHNGSMNLKVVAERKEGFKAPIAIQMVYNPPGVGSAGGVTIPENANEAAILVNANGGAPPRDWKIAVSGTATVGNGPVWVSSQLATLKIAPPYVSFAMERASVEQGKSTQILCKVTQNAPFEGAAKVELVGVPPKVTVPPVEITKETKEFTLQVATEESSPAGPHKNLFCQVLITVEGEPVLHATGGTEIRIDVPLKPRPAAAAVAAKPAAPPPPAARPLSRLEKLRLEQEEREKEGK